MSKVQITGLIVLLLFMFFKAHSQNQANLTNEQKTVKLMFAVKSGFSYLIADTDNSKEALTNSGITPADANRFLSDYTTGWNGRTNLWLRFGDQLETGIVYRYFNTSAEITSFIDPLDGFHLLYGKISESVYLNFIGATLGAYKEFNERLSGRVTYGLGCSILRDETITLNQPILITGNNFALDLTLEGEYKFAKQWSLNAQVGYFISAIKRIKINDGYQIQTTKLTDDEAANLSALDLSVGIAYRF